MIEHDDALYLYTDGACLGNPGPGGWAYVLVAPGGTVEDSGGEGETTNNQMELLSAVEGLGATALGADIVVVTDSEYLKNGMTRWTRGWQRNGWRTATGAPVKNQELWQALLQLVGRRTVRWEWVKGHAELERGGDEFNHRCDALARAAARQAASSAPAKPPAARRRGARRSR